MAPQACNKKSLNAECRVDFSDGHVDQTTFGACTKDPSQQNLLCLTSGVVDFVNTLTRTSLHEPFFPADVTYTADTSAPAAATATEARPHISVRLDERGALCSVLISDLEQLPCVIDFGHGLAEAVATAPYVDTWLRANVLCVLSCARSHLFKMSLTQHNQAARGARARSHPITLLVSRSLASLFP